jgi:hypothetical protein
VGRSLQALGPGCTMPVPAPVAAVPELIHECPSG